MFEKHCQSSVGARHSAKKFSDTPKSNRPNVTPLTQTSYQQLFKHPL